MIERSESTTAVGMAGSDDAANLPLDLLIDYIVNTHHAYVRAALPTIARLLNELQDTQGGAHLELARIVGIFEAVAGGLSQHMVKEERVLFPYIRDLAQHAHELCGRMISPFGSVENPIRMMEREHDEAAKAIRVIREMTNGYAAPDDRGVDYRVCMTELTRFEGDLERHMFLENNVLFPRALALEGRLAGDDQ
jgi:regulator of cell morphogenesis and NO signaling